MWANRGGVLGGKSFVEGASNSFDASLSFAEGSSRGASFGVAGSSCAFKAGELEYAGGSEVTELGAVDVNPFWGSDSGLVGSGSVGDDDIGDMAWL